MGTASSKNCRLVNRMAVTSQRLKLSQGLLESARISSSSCGRRSVNPIEP